MSDRVLATSSHFAADRVALLRTLIYVEKRWREGASCEAVFSEVDRFREQEYDKLAKNPGLMRRLGESIKTLPTEQCRKRLVAEGSIAQRCGEQDA